MKDKNYFASLFISIEVVLFFAFVLPVFHQNKVDRVELVARRVLLADTEAAKRQVEILGRQYTEQEASIQKILIAVPKHRQLDYLTSSIQKAAQESGLDLRSMSFGDSFDDKSGYQIFPVRLELAGNYPAMLSFLEIIEQSLRIYDIADIDISGIANSGGGLMIKISLNSYSLK